KKNKIIFAIPVLLVLILVIFLINSFILVSPEQKQAKALAKQVQSNLKLIKSDIDAHNAAAARKLLMVSLSAIPSSENKVLIDLKNQVLSLLDQVDGAVQAKPALVDGLPKEIADSKTALAAEQDKIKSAKYDLPSPAVDIKLYK